MWYYIFWFPDELLANNFEQDFNGQYGTQTLALRPDSVYPEAPYEELGLDSEDFEDVENLEGWFLEIGSRNELHDVLFDELAASYGGEYDGNSQIRPNPEHFIDPDNSPQIESIIRDLGFIRHPEKPGYWVEPHSNLTVRDRVFRQWAKKTANATEFQKRIKDEIGRFLGY